jgi:hypothetical protein
MRILRKVIVLGLAALGAYKAWELLEPKVKQARGSAADVRDRVEPVLEDAKDKLGTASRDAVDSMVDVARDTTGALANATGANGSAGSAGDAPTSSATATSPVAEERMGN